MIDFGKQWCLKIVILVKLDATETERLLLV